MTGVEIATIAAPLAATFVGLVQAKIYVQQAHNQELANKQALFERRMAAYLDVKSYAEHYIERGGRVGSSKLRDAYLTAMIHAPHIFTERARKAFASVENCLDKHALALPELKYDAYGDIIQPDGPLPIAELKKLESSVKALPAEVESDLNLTTDRRRIRWAKALPLRPTDD